MEEGIFEMFVPGKLESPGIPCICIPGIPGIPGIPCIPIPGGLNPPTKLLIGSCWPVVGGCDPSDDEFCPIPGLIEPKLEGKVPGRLERFPGKLFGSIPGMFVGRLPCNPEGKLPGKKGKLEDNPICPICGTEGLKPILFPSLGIPPSCP